jgi:hypothetical protein
VSIVVCRRWHPPTPFGIICRWILKDTRDPEPEPAPAPAPAVELLWSCCATRPCNRTRAEAVVMIELLDPAASRFGG